MGDACSLGFVMVVFGVRPEDRVEKSRNSFSRSLYLPKKGLSALRTLQGLTLCGKMHFRLFHLLSHLRSGCSCWRCYTKIHRFVALEFCFFKCSRRETNSSLPLKTVLLTARLMGTFFFHPESLKTALKEKMCFSGCGWFTGLFLRSPV